MKKHACNHTIHDHQCHFGWNRDTPPVLRIAPGETVEFHTVDSSGGQLNATSTLADLAALDFGKVNPLVGPDHIEGAQPGDAIEVTLLDFTPSGWGWTANTPGFGLLAHQFKDPALHIWKYDAATRAPRTSPMASSTRTCCSTRSAPRRSGAMPTWSWRAPRAHRGERRGLSGGPAQRDGSLSGGRGPQCEARHPARGRSRPGRLAAHADLAWRRDVKQHLPFSARLRENTARPSALTAESLRDGPQPHMPPAQALRIEQRFWQEVPDATTIRTLNDQLRRHCS